MVTALSSKQKCYLLEVLPNELLQTIAARVEFLKDLTSLGRTCHRIYGAALSPYAESWKSLNSKNFVTLLTDETPKHAAHRFFEQFVGCIFKSTKYFHRLANCTELLSDLEKIFLIPTIGKRYIEALSFLRQHPEIRSLVVLTAIKNTETPAVAEKILREFHSNFSSDDWCEFLRVAAKKGNLQVIQFICSILKDNYEKDPSYLEINSGFISYADFIDDMCGAALFASTQEGHLKVVDFLLDHTIDSESKKDCAGVIALVRGHLDIFKRFFKDKKDDPEIALGMDLIYAISNKDRSKIEGLVSEVNRRFRQLGYYFSCAIGDLGLMDLLFDDNYLSEDFDEVIKIVAKLGLSDVIKKIFQDHIQERDGWVLGVIEEGIVESIVSNQTQMTMQLLNMTNEIKADYFLLACRYGAESLTSMFPANWFQIIPMETILQSYLFVAEKGNNCLLYSLLFRFVLVDHQICEKMILAMAARGHLECLKVLLIYKSMSPQTRKKAMIMAKINQHDEVAQFIEAFNPNKRPILELS